jgi:hypothetical protein
MNVKRQEPGALVTHAGILCGGCWVTGIPTATHYSTVKDVPQIHHIEATSSPHNVIK